MFLYHYVIASPSIEGRSNLKEDDIMIRLVKERFRLFRGQGGFSLVEGILAVAILAVIGVVFMSAMTTGFRSAGIQDEQITAESLARTQLEIIKAATYADNYTDLKISEPSQYLISIESPYVSWNGTDWLVESEEDTGLQKITVRVSREGGKPVLMVEALKTE